MKRVLSLIIAALLLAGGIALFRAKDSRQEGPADPATAQVAPPRSGSGPAHESAHPAEASRVDVRRTPEEVQTVVASIQDATVEYSDSTLPQFEKWLADPSREIRDAATDGLLQSGLAGGAPLLRAAAATTKDKAEAEEQERAASILELPPASAQIIEQRKADGKQRPPAKHFNLNELTNPPTAQDTKPEETPATGR